MKKCVRTEQFLKNENAEWCFLEHESQVSDRCFDQMLLFAWNIPVDCTDTTTFCKCCLLGTGQ